MPSVLMLAGFTFSKHNSFFKDARSQKKKVAIWVCEVKTSGKVIWRAGGKEFTHNWELLIIQVKDKYILHMPSSSRQFVFKNLSETDFPDKN